MISQLSPPSPSSIFMAKFVRGGHKERAEEEEEEEEIRPGRYSSVFLSPSCRLQSVCQHHLFLKKKKKGEEEDEREEMQQKMHGVPQA